MMPERFLWGTGNGSSKGPKSEEFQFQTRLVQVSMLALAFRRILFQLISVGKPMWHQWQPVFLSVLACKALCKVMMVSKRALRPEFIMLDRWVADDGQVCFMYIIYIYVYLCACVAYPIYLLLGVLKASQSINFVVFVHKCALSKCQCLDPYANSYTAGALHRQFPWKSQAVWVMSCLNGSETEFTQTCCTQQRSLRCHIGIRVECNKRIGANK